MKKRIFTFALLLLFLSFAGCDYNELNMQEIVTHAGVDIRDGTVTVSVLCASGNHFSSEGRSFFEAVRALSGMRDKKLYWGHTGCVVFSEDALESSFDETLDALARASDVYRDISPVALVGANTKELFSDTAACGRVLDTFLNEENSRRFKAYPLWELSRTRELFGVCIIPTIQFGGDGFAMSGGAVMSENSLAGYLTGEQMLFLSLLTDERSGGYLPVIEEKGGRLSFEILANDISHRRVGENKTIVQKITLSPAEVKGDFTDGEMKATAEKYLAAQYKALSTFADENGYGKILSLFGGVDAEKTEFDISVKISNVFGGR